MSARLSYTVCCLLLQLLGQKTGGSLRQLLLEISHGVRYLSRYNDHGADYVAPGDDRRDAERIDIGGILISNSERNSLSASS